jgi:chromosome segregation ATPase
MKDGFDRSVAQKMPRMQKKRPNRPWNIDPVLLNDQKEHVVQNVAEDKPILKSKRQPQKNQVDPSKAVETIIDLNSDITQVIFEKKEIQRQLMESSKTLSVVERENASLKDSVAAIENTAVENKMIEREIIFLNEQLEDADYYIKNMVGLLDERTQNLDRESARRKELEGKLTRISHEIQGKAKVDVKVSILERDLGISSARVLDLESQLEEESKKREPLEQEIVELKDALDRVYSSLAHIRLKAKREVYGS